MKGRFDVEATSLPLSQVVTHGSLRIGFVEGFTLVSTEPDLLLAEANKLDVDVLCWGGTHRFDAFEYMDKFFVNPGSATGAYTTGWTKEGEEMVPSFCLMDVSLSLSLSLSLSFFFFCFLRSIGNWRHCQIDNQTSPTSPLRGLTCANNCFTGARHIAYTLRISIEERCKRRGKRGRREGDIHKTCRANRRLLMNVKKRLV